MRSKGTLKAWARIGIAGVAFVCLETVGPAARAAEFSYSGDNGPGFWGELDPAWVNCSEDQRQSPIDIEQAVRDATLGPVELDLHATEINLVNNGHTIEQEYQPGSALTFEGVVYELKQFHFHTLSEHAINGERGVMELHVVFANAATG